MKLTETAMAFTLRRWHSRYGDGITLRLRSCVPTSPFSDIAPRAMLGMSGRYDLFVRNAALFLPLRAGRIPWHCGPCPRQPVVPSARRERRLAASASASALDRSPSPRVASPAPALPLLLPSAPASPAPALPPASTSLAPALPAARAAPAAPAAPAPTPVPEWLASCSEVIHRFVDGNGLSDLWRSTQACAEPGRRRRDLFPLPLRLDAAASPTHAIWERLAIHGLNALFGVPTPPCDQAPTAAQSAVLGRVRLKVGRMLARLVSVACPLPPGEALRKLVGTDASSCSQLRADACDLIAPSAQVEVLESPTVSHASILPSPHCLGRQNIHRLYPFFHRCLPIFQTSLGGSE